MFINSESSESRTLKLIRVPSGRHVVVDHHARFNCRMSTWFPRLIGVLTHAKGFTSDPLGFYKGQSYPSDGSPQEFLFFARARATLLYNVQIGRCYASFFQYGHFLLRFVSFKFLKKRIFLAALNFFPFLFIFELFRLSFFLSFLLKKGDSFDRCGKKPFFSVSLDGASLGLRGLT